ncbi:hypothetical protein HDU77_009861 [Chytriomyces hyalinus]|nr:hypothetical protein HDU77_009861 [Chytriomyces hyalinus]
MIAAAFFIAALVPDFARADAISDGIKGLSMYPPCYLACMNVATPVTRASFDAACSTIMSSEPSNSTAANECQQKCPLPTDYAGMIAFSETFANATMAVVYGCQAAMYPKMLLETIQHFPACLVTCFNGQRATAVVDEVTVQGFCNLASHPADAKVTLEPCLKRLCGATMATQLESMLSSVSNANASENALPMICNLIYGGGSSVVQSSIPAISAAFSSMAPSSQVETGSGQKPTSLTLATSSSPESAANAGTGQNAQTRATPIDLVTKGGAVRVCVGLVSLSVALALV